MEHIDQDLSLVLEQLEQRRPKGAGVPPVRCSLVVWKHHGVVGAALRRSPRLHGQTALRPPCMMPAPSGASVHAAVPWPLLQVKPLERSLENVNGRGCNETATGELDWLWPDHAVPARLSRAHDPCAIARLILPLTPPAPVTCPQVQPTATRRASSTATPRTISGASTPPAWRQLPSSTRTMCRRCSLRQRRRRLCFM